MARLIPRLAELITNPASGRLSTSDTLVVGAFVATTLALVWYTLTSQLTEWLFIGYLAAWVTQNQASKWSSIKRDREAPNEPKNTVKPG